MRPLTLSLPSTVPRAPVVSGSSGPCTGLRSGSAICFCGSYHTHDLVHLSALCPCGDPRPTLRRRRRPCPSRLPLDTFVLHWRRNHYLSADFARGTNLLLRRAPHAMFVTCLGGRLISSRLTACRSFLWGGYYLHAARRLVRTAHHRRSPISATPQPPIFLGAFLGLPPPADIHLILERAVGLLGWDEITTELTARPVCAAQG